MRLWSLHPEYLDRAGLVALWREGLLAQAVLRGETRGYRHHPQLERFREQRDPVRAIAAYLHRVADEADARGYSFDRAKLPRIRGQVRIDVTRGQLLFEWQHLRTKLRIRDPIRYRELRRVADPAAHPSFTLVDGPVAGWERGASLL